MRKEKGSNVEKYLRGKIVIPLAYCCLATIFSTPSPNIWRDFCKRELRRNFISFRLNLIPDRFDKLRKWERAEIKDERKNKRGEEKGITKARVERGAGETAGLIILLKE